MNKFKVWRKSETYQPRVIFTVTALLVAVALSACTAKEVIIQDFSRTIVLEPPSTSKNIVGLIVKTNLESPAEIILNVGCKGDVNNRITVPPNHTTVRRIDWYSKCAEFSFSPGSVTPKSMTLHYRFLTL